MESDGGELRKKKNVAEWKKKEKRMDWGGG